MNCKIDQKIYNSYRDLLESNLITCDLCDRVFQNGFDSIIHNASHIIIPLINLNFLFCKICKSVFISQDDLDLHTLREHPEEKIIKSDIDDEKLFENEEEPHNFDVNLVKKEVIDDVDTIPTVPMINRLKFEDEDDGFNDILKDLVTECQVNVKIHNKWNGVVKTNTISSLKTSLEQLRKLEENNSGVNKSISETLTDEYACDNYAPKSNDDEKFESIHYRILINPGIYNCKHCPKSFANRFNLIQHEIVHIKFTRPKPLLCQYCDKFIAGNHYDLHRHIDKKHIHEGPYSYLIPKTCQKCGLWYRNYVRHAKNYHFSEYQLNSRSEEQTKVTKVCDLCLPTLKSKCKFKYIVKGSTEPVDGRFPCHECGNRCFVLNIVERTKRCHKRRKHMSNEVRLKMIQRRFQRLNLLSRV